MKQFFKENKQSVILYSTVTIIGIITYFLLLRFDHVATVLRFILSVFAPFLIGFSISYLLNPVMKFFELRVFGKVGAKKRTASAFKVKRVCSIISTYVVVFALVACLVVLLIPQVVTTVESLIKNIPSYYQKFVGTITHFMSEHHMNAVWLEQMLPDHSLMTYATTFIEACFGWLMNIPAQLTTGFTNVLVGVIVSIYFLYDKERFTKGLTKVTYAMCHKKKADKIMEVSRLTNKTFSGFIIGKIIDSVIIGAISFPFMLLIYPPYALLISVIIGVTNIIPFFGPFIGAIPSALLILLVAPDKFLWFVIFIFVLQQFDGNILGPKILGDSTGISPIWVMFGILAGSKLLGFVGMLVGVPVTAVAYYLFRNYIDRKYQEKQNNEPKTCETDS